MANAPVVYTGNNPNGTSGTLFEGKKFWLSHNVPQQSRFKELIQVSIPFCCRLQETRGLEE